MFRCGWVFAFALLVCAPFCVKVVFSQADSKEAVFDLVIRQARIVDGTGNPWFRGDVAVKDGRIAAVASRVDGRANREIAGAGLVLAPGFIDVHTHIEGGVFESPQADNFLFDGVTTVITGNCGGSAWPLKDFFARMEEEKIGINVASLIGHNTVRRQVLGDDLVQPDSAQLAAMRGLVADAMEEGAVGLSTGLIYLPGLFAKTEEVVALAKESAKRGGVYATHMRTERTVKILDALDEAIAIGREARIPVEISHLKVGKELDGLERQVLAKIDAARAEGLDVTADQYPYAASSTTLVTTLPDWAIAGGEAAMRERLSAPETRRRIADEVLEAREKAGHTNLDYIAIAAHEPEPALNGKHVPEITALRGRPAGLESDVETVLELLSKPGRTSVIYHSWSEPGVDAILRHPAVAVASDGGIQTMGKHVPHPRSYGTNARVLGRFVRERQVISLEEAIRKMTSLPARTFRLRDRGLILPGYMADLVLFNEKEVIDNGTYDHPHQLSAGFSYVMVNGVLEIDGGQRSSAMAGRVVRRQ